MSPALAVGTTNPGKVEAVRRAIAGYARLSAFDLTAVKVESGVADQPMTMQETTQGAKNRARAAFEGLEGASLGIGLESGLFFVEEKLFDVGACAIFDGEQSHIGYSCAWELPVEVAKKIVDEGQNLSEAINSCGLCDDPAIGDKGGAIALMTGGRITRPDYTVQSIQMAILALNPAHYACSSRVPGGINDAPSGAPGDITSRADLKRQRSPPHVHEDK